MSKAPKTTHTAHEGVASIPTELIYGTTKLAIADIPTVSQIALMARGLSHILGNEVASKVSGKVKKWAEENETLETDDEEAFVAARDENAEAWKLEAYAEALAKIMGGTLGLRAVGPRGTAIETDMRAIAIDEIKAVLAKSGIKWPAKADGVIVTKSGDKTRAQLVEDYLTKHDYRLRAEAHRRQALIKDGAAEVEL